MSKNGNARKKFRPLVKYVSTGVGIPASGTVRFPWSRINPELASYAYLLMKKITISKNQLLYWMRGGGFALTMIS